MYQVAVILINYNSSNFTLNAVNSIISTTSKALNYQIIVIDNASQYDDYHHLKQNIAVSSNITLFRSKINTGFGAGNMLGIQFANAKHYAFVNNDTVLKNDCLSVLYNFIETEDTAAMCAPQSFDEDGNVLKSFDYFLTLKRELLGRKTLRKLHPKKYPKRNQTYTTPLKVDSIPGSFLYVDAVAFNAVGGFDTNIFLYYEETDLAYRINALNGKNACFLVPEAKYIHYRGQSTSKNMLIKKELKLSLLYVIKKNSSYMSFILLKTILTFKYLFKSLFKPKYYMLFQALFFKGASLHTSLKQSQKIASK